MNGANINSTEEDAGVPFILVTISINLFSIINYFYFYKAAQNGHVDAIEVLLKRGANIEAKETNVGATPLYIGNNLNKYIFFY